MCLGVCLGVEEWRRVWGRGRDRLGRDGHPEEEGVSVEQRSSPLFTCVETDQPVRGTQLLDLVGFFPLYFKTTLWTKDL